MTTEPVHLNSVDFASVVVTDRTSWTFARVHDVEGASAEVELTASDDIGEVIRLVADAIGFLSGSPIAAEADIPAMLGLEECRLRRDKALATSVSALRTGVSVIQAVKAGISLAQALGGDSADSVPIYANINRGLFATPRTPADFANAAERAVRDGFRAVKCAPFDEVSPGGGSEAAVRLAGPGIRRAEAIRDAIGPDVKLLIDCHSRFDVESAVIVAEGLAELGIDWFEEPVQPTDDPAGMAQIAERVSMPVAGGEDGYGEDMFAGLIRREAVRVIMPDVKHCGGAAAAARSGIAAIEAGASVSLHSPSGPVSLLASGHVTAAMPGAMPLEHAVYEAEWRADLLTPPERVEDGCLYLPGGPGLGAELDWDLLRRVGRVWS